MLHQTMAEKVTPIRAGGAGDPTIRKTTGEVAELSVTLRHGLPVLLAELTNTGLQDDLRTIWSAYPNLEEATQKLLQKISIVWPSREDPNLSAVVKATIKAVQAVKHSIDVGERSRAQVVAAYLQELATVADDVATIKALGVHGKNQQRWTLEDPDLWKWLGDSGFDEIKFMAVDEPNPNEVTGTRIKLLCAIATTRDVGLVGRRH